MSSSTFFAAAMVPTSRDPRRQTSWRNDVPHGREDGRSSRKQRWGRAAVLGLSALTCLAAVLCNSIAISFGHLCLCYIPGPLHFLLPRSAFLNASLESTFAIAALGTVVTAVPLFVDAILFWHQVADEQAYPTIPSLKPLCQLTPRSVSSRAQALLWECWLILAGPIGLFVCSAFDFESDDTLGVVGLVLAAIVGRLSVMAVRWFHGRWCTSRAPVQVDEAEIEAELEHLRAEA
ncbi:hypothetical protein OH76DRAFT_665813 [Lentinus brumalis]|uniref:Uncharacterized protein n=1 Tax=Lentinus brumalis TaxID=2498619 RepID=A0A371D731_9APHY|nr:hypothetical protein OH76DRAFT_665813 [Polyporus brumalis]